MILRAECMDTDMIGIEPVLQGHLALAAIVSREVCSWEMQHLAALATDGYSPSYPPSRMATIATGG